MRRGIPRCSGVAKGLAPCKGRDKRQPLDLDLPERRIRFDEDGRVVGIEIPQRLAAHRLIEEFMIQANVAAAESLEESHAPRSSTGPTKSLLGRSSKAFPISSKR